MHINHHKRAPPSPTPNRAIVLPRPTYVQYPFEFELKQPPPSGQVHTFLDLIALGCGVAQVLKDKIKNLQWKLEEERQRREALEQQLGSLQKQ